MVLTYLPAVTSVSRWPSCTFGLLPVAAAADDPVTGAAGEEQALVRDRPRADGESRTVTRASGDPRSRAVVCRRS
jgi:hypothetical protein